MPLVTPIRTLFPIKNAPLGCTRATTDKYNCGWAACDTATNRRRFPCFHGAGDVRWHEQTRSSTVARAVGYVRWTNRKPAIEGQIKMHHAHRQRNVRGKFCVNVTVSIFMVQPGNHTALQGSNKSKQRHRRYPTEGCNGTMTAPSPWEVTANTICCSSIHLLTQSRPYVVHRSTLD